MYEIQANKIHKIEFNENNLHLQIKINLQPIIDFVKLFNCFGVNIPCSYSSTLIDGENLLLRIVVDCSPCFPWFGVPLLELFPSDES